MNALISLPDSELQRLISNSPDQAVRRAALMMLTQRRAAETMKLPAVLRQRSGTAVTQNKPVQNDDDIAFDWD